MHEDLCMGTPKMGHPHAHRYSVPRNPTDNSGGFEGADLFGDFKRQCLDFSVEEPSFARGQFLREFLEGCGMTGGERGETGGVGHAAAQPDYLRHTPLSVAAPRGIGARHQQREVLGQLPFGDEFFAKLAVIRAEDDSLAFHQARRGTDMGAKKVDKFLGRTTAMPSRPIP
jgi:hypothetical protein